jgi:hypothetical protein
LNYLFAEYYSNKPSDDDIKELCKSRRCILDEVNNNEKYSYKYLCNYDPTSEFYEKGKIYKKYSLNGKEMTSINQLECNSITQPYFSLKTNELFQYLSLCYNFNEFYYCNRFDKPEKVYEIAYGESCPEENYLLLSYILCVLIILIDIVITMLPWGVEYISLKRILQLMSITRRKPNSHNSTQKSSVITNNNNEESFKKTQTQVIVVPLNNEEEIINVNRRKLIIQDDDYINNEENRKKIQPIKIVQNSERDKINSSINVFGKNKENIPTEMNNQNVNNNVRSQIEIAPINSKKK